MVGSIGNGKDVGRQFPQAAVLVHLDILWVVNGEELKRVDCNQYGTHVGVDVGVDKPVQMEKICKYILGCPYKIPILTVLVWFSLVL